MTRAGSTVDAAATAGDRVRRWAHVVRRRWLTGLLIFASLAALSAAVVFLSRPVYRAEGSLRLGEPPPAPGVSPTAGIVGFLRMGGDPFANDLELLGSRTVTEAVVLDAALAVRIRGPRDWYRDSLFTILAASRATEQARFRAQWLQDGSVRVRRTAPSDSLVGDVAPGELLEFGGVTVAFRSWRQGMPRTIEIRSLPFGEAVRRAERSVRAERMRREANVVGLRFDHGDPGVARQALAAAVDRFVELRAALHRREASQTTDSLRTVADETLAHLAAAEASMAEFQRRVRLFAPEAQGEAFVERHTAVLVALERAGRELDAIDSYLTRLARRADSNVALTELAGFPAFLENATIAELVNRLTELEAVRSDVLTRRAETSRELQVLGERSEYLASSLRSLAAGYRDALAEEVARLSAERRELERELDAVPSRVVELGRRQRDVRLLSEVYLVTEHRLRQEELRQALTFANVQVVDPPALRYRPVWPRPKLGMAVGLLLAGLFAVLGVVVHERADRAVLRAAQVRAATGAPVLGALAPGLDGRMAIPADALHAVLRHGVSGAGGGQLLLVPIGVGVTAEEAARAVFVGAVEGGAAGAAERGGVPEISVTASPATFSTAAAVAAQGVPATLVVERGRTSVDELERAVAFLADAGGRVAGSLVVCRRAGDISRLWT